MNGLWAHYLSCAITMAALTLIIALLSPFLGKRYRARSLYVTWFVLLAGFLIPLRLSAVLPAMTVQLPFRLSQHAFPIADASPQTAAQSVAYEVSDSESSTADTPVPAMAQKSQPTHSYTGRLTWLDLSSWLWLAGACSVLAFQCIRHIFFLRTVRRWQQPITNVETLRIFDLEKQRLHIRKPIALLLCPTVNSPMALGLWRQRLLLPDDDLTPEELPMVLRHELIHLKRRDLWVKAALVFAKALHWFNPAIYLLSRQLAFWQESACDEAVTIGESFEAKQFYSETIIRTIRKQTRMKTPMTTSFYGGKNGMKRRIVAILESGGKRAGVSLCIVTSILVSCLGIAFAVSAVPEATVPPQTTVSAYVSRVDAQGAPMLFLPTASDLKIPIAVYFVGTPVTIVDRVESSAPAEWGDSEGKSNWAQVLVGGDGSATGISGWIPLVYLSAVPTELPTATLATDSVTGYVNLYTLNDTDSTLINTYRAGTHVTLLGRVQKWYQVKLNGVYGFVQRDSLAMAAAVQARFDTFCPDRFDDVNRKEYQKSITFQALCEQKTAAYGGLGVDDWSLEDKAWYGQMEETYLGTHDYYYQLPQAGDLKESDAIAIAWQTFTTQCKHQGASQEDYDFNLSFYSIPDMNGDLKKWDIRIRLKGGSAYYSVTIASPSGVVEAAGSAEGYLLESESEADSIAYNAAMTQWEQDLNKPYAYWSVEDKAAFSAQYGDGSILMPNVGATSQEKAETLARNEIRIRYDIAANVLSDWKTGAEYRMESNQTPCWYITFYGADDSYLATVTLDAFTGKILNCENPYGAGNG